MGGNPISLLPEQESMSFCAAAGPGAAVGIFLLLQLGGSWHPILLLLGPVQLTTSAAGLG